MILTPLQKLPNNVGDLGKIIVATSFEWLPKVEKIAQSGHTGLCYLLRAIFFRKVTIYVCPFVTLKQNRVKSHATSVTKLGNFLEPLDNKFSNKNSPNVWRLLGQFWNTYFLSQAAVATFWEIWATFYSKIWTHCILQLFIKEAHFFVLSYNNNDNNGGPTPQKHLPPTLSLRNILKTWIPHFHLIYVTLLHHGIKAINGSNGSGF